MMWEYNFEDYNFYCELYGLSPCKLSSLYNFREFINFGKRIMFKVEE